jgi:predicted peptidase
MLGTWMWIMLHMLSLGEWDDRIDRVEIPGENGRTYRFTILMPEALETEKRYPLIMALHFAGRGEFYGGRFMEILVAPAFAKQDWIIVAPDCPGNGWGSDEAHALMPELLDHLAASYPVDERKALVGFSMGASGAGHWVDRMPGDWRAAVVLSGRVPEVEVENLSRTPFYVIHSRDDELIPLSRTLPAINSLRRAGVDIKLVPRSGPGHYQTPAFVPAPSRSVSWLSKRLE